MKLKAGQFILITIFTIALFSCSEDEKTPELEQGISTIEAAEEIGISLSTDISIYATDAYTLTQEIDVENGANGRVEACGVAYDTTFTKSYDGPNVTFESTLSYGYSLSCNEFNIPTSYTASYSSEHTRNGVRLESSGNSEGSLTASDLQPSATSYVVNGNYSSEKNIASKVDANKSFTSSSSATMNDITINKATLAIQSGSATYTLIGTSPNRGEFLYEASVVFNGDGTATITINGESYTVNLRNGEIEE